jgi:hypothetical protein
VPDQQARVQTGIDADPNSPYWQRRRAMQLVLWQSFLDGRPNFDYTMVTGTPGRRWGAR